MHPDVTPPEYKFHNGVFCELISTRTKTWLYIYFYVIMESDDFKTALEVALQFFPGIKLKRENRNCSSKACLSNEKTSSSGFCRLRISDWLFHRKLTRTPIFNQYNGPKPDLYRRYIDDCVGATSSTREELNQFITAVNSFHPALKYTWEISDTSLAFLDIKVSVEGNGLCTSKK